MGCGTSKSVQTAVETTNRSQNTNDNFESKPTAPKDKAPDTSLIERGENQFSIGHRVHVSGYTGAVKFIGYLSDPSGGEWIGIELDHPHPQGNDGFFDGVRYFTCAPRHGMFARPSVVFRHKNAENITTATNISLETIAFIQTNIRRFLARIRLEKFKQRSGIEKQIDAHVLATPAEQTESVEKLSAYLTSRWEGDRNKAYAIFRWLSFNVAYDADGFFGRTERKSGDAESVLRHRTAVCAGYANLFDALGKAADLQVHTINGYAKGYGFEPGQRIKETNHAWNGVLVNGEWFVCEPTWGAGYLGADLMFHRSPDVSMFLMDPEYAIYSHYPSDEQWQLLEKPISKKEFEKLVAPSGRIHKMGVEILSHKESMYDIDDADHVEMMFYSPSLKILRGDLKDFSGRDYEGRRWTQILPCGVNQVKLKAQFPAPGKYKLKLYVRDELIHTKWHSGIEYIIQAKRGVKQNRGGFPQLGSEFYEAGFSLDHPSENIVSDDGKAYISLQNFNIQISHIVGRLDLVGDEKRLKKHFGEFSFCYSERTESGFRVMVHCPLAGEYTLKVFAKYYDERKSDTFVCTYYINALAGVEPVPGFPRLSDRFVSWGLELKEPQHNIYAPDGRASIKLKTPDNVSVVGYLMKDKQHLDNSLCFSNTAEYVGTILAHAPEAGVFKLNVFGKKPESKDSEYLATFMIKSDQAASSNPGFPYLKDEFKEWGLELVDQLENIVSRVSHVKVTFSNPHGIALKPCLFDAHNKQIDNYCSVETADKMTVITCELPEAGKFKLNVFGTNPLIESTKRVYLCTYKLLLTK